MFVSKLKLRFLGVWAPPDCPRHPYILGGYGSPDPNSEERQEITLLTQDNLLQKSLQILAMLKM